MSTSTITPPFSPRLDSLVRACARDADTDAPIADQPFTAGEPFSQILESLAVANVEHYRHDGERRMRVLEVVAHALPADERAMLMDALEDLVRERMATAEAMFRVGVAAGRLKARSRREDAR